MQYNPEEYTEILNIFKAESEEIIQALNDGFLELEKNPNDKTPIKKLFQLAHSIKGAARMIGFNGIQDVAHKLEDILSYWKNDNVDINPASFEIIYNVCDFLSDAVEKSVQQKSDYVDENLMHFLLKLDNFINAQNVSVMSKKNKKDNNKIYSKSTDINAILLELMFVLEKDDDNSDIDEIIMVASDNLSRLQEIFEESDFDEIKKHISKISDNLSSNTNKNKSVSQSRAEVALLKDEIYKELNVLSSPIEQKEKKNIVDESPKLPVKDDTGHFDEILKNLPKIKTDKAYIANIISELESIAKLNINEHTNALISKILKILTLFNNKNTLIDNDCFIVILQGIYLAQRMSLNDSKENLNNLNFLLQRLTVVEDLFDIEEVKEIKKSDETSVEHQFSGSDIDILKKNLNFFELQEIKTLRVDTTKIDNLISQTGELLVNGIKTREHLNELSEINLKLIQWNSASKKIMNYFKYLEKKGLFSYDSDDSSALFYKKMQNFFLNNSDIISELQNDFGHLYNIISEDDNKLHQTAMEIETIAKGIRILPLATIFHSFPRMMRDLANENNKKIDFIVSGSDTTVDKKLIEEIKMPLIHILRNAVSHGIEIPHERLKNGKSEIGVVKLSAKQADNNVVITIEDDGYGINLEKVKKIAIKKGLLFQEEVENMSNDQLMKLLFLPGFSTNDSINEISGRGVGLDIVKTKITNLNGEIQIDSVLNKGCRVTIKLPLVMSTLKTFIIMVNGQKYAIPVSSIKFVKTINKDEIFLRNGQNCIIYDNHSIPIYSISEVLGENSDINSSQMTVIIMENQEKQSAFIIDKLLGDQEVFHKRLIAPIVKIKNISGFTTLSNGEICLIINPYELINNTIYDKSLPSFDWNKLVSTNSINERFSEKVVVFDDGSITFIKEDIEQVFKNTVVFNNIYPMYDYIQKNDVDIFVCKIDAENKEILKLLQYIKNDEMLNKIKIVVVSDLAWFDVLSVLNHFKPDVYVKTSEYDSASLINQLQ